MAKDKNAEPQRNQQQPEKMNVRIRYDSMDTVFASQFIVHASREELILNLSPGYISDPGTNERILPIQSRIAITPQGAARLVQALSTVLRKTYGANPGKETTDAKTKGD